MVDITVSVSEEIMSINGVYMALVAGFEVSIEFEVSRVAICFFLTKWQCCKCDMVVIYATLSYHYSIGSSFHPDNATVNTIPCDDYASV